MFSHFDASNYRNQSRLKWIVRVEIVSAFAHSTAIQDGLIGNRLSSVIENIIYAVGGSNIKIEKEKINATHQAC